MTFLIPAEYLTEQLKGGKMYSGLVFEKAQLIMVGKAAVEAENRTKHVARLQLKAGSQ